MSLFARIAGTGSYLPPKRLTNQDLVDQLAAKGLESSDEWIVDRTGIRARHFVDDGVHASDLAFEASRRCLVAAGKRVSDVDLIIVATSTPDMVFPSTASILQHKMRLAALSEGDDEGGAGGAACVPGTVANGRILGDPLLKMDGQAVFKLAVGVLEKTARAVLEKAGKTEADVDWLVPHQANIRIMTSTAKKLKIPIDRVVVTVDQHGNTSAASIPLALDHGVRAGDVLPGQTVLMEGVGGGFTWGSALVRM